MNITSYNVTDVGYHYIGLRVLKGLSPAVQREEQTNTISRNIRKYAMERALRLMLPEPKGTFDSAGRKTCQELVHLELANSGNRVYELTRQGQEVLDLLENRQFSELRRAMICAHLRTYDNLRLIVQKHLEVDGIFRPVVEASKVENSEYVARLLEPTFGTAVGEQVSQELGSLENMTAGKLEDELRNTILKKILPGVRVSESLFRSMCDRLVSLRILNLRKSYRNECEFDKSYSLCDATPTSSPWYSLAEIDLKAGKSFALYICEPDMKDPQMQELLLSVVRESFTCLKSKAGYYSLPEVRDIVCERLRIPEVAFDDGLNHLLDTESNIFTLGLEYEGISGRRKPFVRDRGSVQIYNLVRSI